MLVALFLTAGLVGTWAFQAETADALRVEIEEEAWNREELECQTLQSICRLEGGEDKWKRIGECYTKYVTCATQARGRYCMRLAEKELEAPGCVGG